MKQIYDQYSPADKLMWKTLFERQMNCLPDLADSGYLEALKTIGFEADSIPNFEEVNKKLSALTGWQIEVVEGLIPNERFYDLLANRRFPASTWLRKPEQLEYLEEPDMFHDVFGHIPLLSNQNFCNFLKGFSEVALKYLDTPEGLESIARLYWFTVEFGLIREGDKTKIYGAGIISSAGESVFSLGDKPERRPFSVEGIVNNPYYIDRFQDRYYVIESYKQLFDSLPEIDRVLSGKLQKAKV